MASERLRLESEWVRLSLARTPSRRHPRRGVRADWLAPRHLHALHGLSAAFKVGYISNFVPQHTNIFEGCFWTDALDHGIHVAASNVTAIVKDCVFTSCHNGAIYKHRRHSQAPCTAQFRTEAFNTGLRYDPCIDEDFFFILDRFLLRSSAK